MSRLLLATVPVVWGLATALGGTVALAQGIATAPAALEAFAALLATAALGLSAAAVAVHRHLGRGRSRRATTPAPPARSLKTRLPDPN
jgi:hypothetical protein